MKEKTKISKETILRTILLVIALVNQILIMVGKNPLPFAEEDIYTALSIIASVVTTFWAWWKNNSVTPAAIKADEYMHELKKGGAENG